MADPLLISNADIDGVLKRVYSGFRESVFPLTTPLLANIKKGKPGGPMNMKWGGEGVRFDVVLTRPTGMVASDAGNLPENHVATEKQGNLDIKRLYVRRVIDGLAITGTQSKDAAYISLAKKIVSEMKSAAELGMQEILHGDGSAVKGLVSTVNSTTSIIVTSPYGKADAGQGGLLLDKDMYVAVLDTDGATAGVNGVLGRARIASATVSGDFVTLVLGTAIANMAAGDKVVPATTVDTSFNAYPNGLMNITNRANGYASLHGLSNGTYSRWDAVRLVAGTDTSDANQPTEVDVWRLITRVAGVSGIDAKLRPSEFLLMTTPGIEQQIIESLLPQRQFDASSTDTTIKGGFKAAKICGLNLVSDFWCPAGTIYLVHLPSLFWIDSKDWGQVEFEGAGPWRYVADKDAFETTYGAYLNVGTGRRNAHGAITGYVDTFRASFVQ
jgi:hypothetical protein